MNVLMGRGCLLRELGQKRRQADAQPANPYEADRQLSGNISRVLQGVSS
jgi:hypothetical protein